MWEYYNVTELSTSWSDKRKRLRRDRRIDCFQPNCNWTTSDSRRMSNTSNLVGHLAKHNIFAPSVSVEQAPTQTLEKLWFKTSQLSLQEKLKQNILRWIVADHQSFSTIENVEFRQIFEDIPGVQLPIESRRTLVRELHSEYTLKKQNLKDELASTCSTIALSLDVWTSHNHLSILAIVGHWLTSNFEYKERLLAFKEVEGVHSRENLAAIVMGPYKNSNCQKNN